MSPSRMDHPTHLKMPSRMNCSLLKTSVSSVLLARFGIGKSSLATSCYFWDLSLTRQHQCVRLRFVFLRVDSNVDATIQPYTRGMLPQASFKTIPYIRIGRWNWLCRYCSGSQTWTKLQNIYNRPYGRCTPDPAKRGRLSGISDSTSSCTTFALGRHEAWW